MITLHDVIDIRNWQYYTIVVVKKRNAKWFIPAGDSGEEE